MIDAFITIVLAGYPQRYLALLKTVGLYEKLWLITLLPEIFQLGNKDPGLPISIQDWINQSFEDDLAVNKELQSRVDQFQASQQQLHATNLDRINRTQYQMLLSRIVEERNQDEEQSKENMDMKEKLKDQD